MLLGAYFGGLIVFLCVLIMSAMQAPELVKNMFSTLIVVGVLWPLSLPLALFLGSRIGQ